MEKKKMKKKLAKEWGGQKVRWIVLLGEAARNALESSGGSWTFKWEVDLALTKKQKQMREYIVAWSTAIYRVEKSWRLTDLLTTIIIVPYTSDQVRGKITMKCSSESNETFSREIYIVGNRTIRLFEVSRRKFRILRIKYLKIENKILYALQ